MYKRSQIHFFFFPFWLSIAPLMKPISLKCIGQRSHCKGIGKRKLTLLRGLSVNTSYNFFANYVPLGKFIRQHLVKTDLSFSEMFEMLTF